MTFEWDEAKNQANKRKHGISFEEAAKVFLDPEMLEKYDSAHSTDEEDRYSIIGMIPFLRVIFVICTFRGNDRIRIISARPAEKNEEAIYYENYDAR